MLRNLIGREMERGALPNEGSSFGPMIRNIFHGNAKRYLALRGLQAAMKSADVIRTPEGNRHRG